MNTKRIKMANYIFELDAAAEERLNTYRKELAAYFTSYEDAGELMEEIELRIVEILLETREKTKHLGVPEIAHLIDQIGTVEAFVKDLPKEGHEIVLPEVDEKKASAAPSQQASKSEKGAKKRRIPFLYLDPAHRVFLGVAAGIASCIGIDRTWIRIIWLILALNFVTAWVAIFSIVLYLGLAVVLSPMPTNYKPRRVPRRIFRDMDERVIGGVAGGLGAFLSIDPAWVRVAFLLLAVLSGGMFILIYIITWCVIPRAKTVIQRIHMRP